MTLKQAIKDPSWLLERMSNQKVEGNDGGGGFRHVDCPEMLWEELARLVEGLKVEEPLRDDRPNVSAFEKWWLAYSTDISREEIDLFNIPQMATVIGMLKAAWQAAQHLKREQELEITAAQAEVLDAILAEHTTDSVDYELAADDMGAALALLSEKQREQEPAVREDALFQAANTAAVNLATSMNLRQHPDSCECYGCGLNRAVVNFALSRAKENVRPIVERELRAEKWTFGQPREQEPAPRVTPEMMSNVFAQSVQRKDSEHNHIYDHRIAAELLNKLLAAQPPGTTTVKRTGSGSILLQDGLRPRESTSLRQHSLAGRWGNDKRDVENAANHRERALTALA